MAVITIAAREPAQLAAADTRAAIVGLGDGLTQQEEDRSNTMALQQMIPLLLATRYALVAAICASPSKSQDMHVLIKRTHPATVRPRIIDGQNYVTPGYSKVCCSPTVRVLSPSRAKHDCVVGAL